MTEARKEAGGEPHAPDVIRPGPDAAMPLDLAADARRKKEKLPSLSERLEARVDSYIAELRRDKQQLEEEVRWLRVQEIHHLREDVRWLGNLTSWQSQELVKTRTSYASAVAFSWLSFALIAIGGCVVSDATFVHPEAQRMIATAGLVGLFIGVTVQGVNSMFGTRLMLGKANPPGADTRPRPNPRSPT